MPVLSRGLMDTTVLSKNRAPGAEGLLWNEPLGLAIDATTEGGTVYVRDTTPANNRYNEPLNGWFGSAGLLTNSGTSPKLCQWNDGTLHWSAHNYCQQSQTFDNASWGKGLSITVTANATTAPDGTSTADALVSPNSTTQPYIHNETIAGIVPSGSIVTYSVFAKPNGWNWIELQVADSVNYITYATRSFNVSTGATGTDRTVGYSVVGGSATAVGNGWYRCYISVLIPTANGAPGSLGTPIGSSDAFSGSFVGDGTSGVYVWGAQFNRGITPTGYLATTAAAVYGIPQQYDVTTNQFGILCEPAATNLCLRSQEFNNAAWSVGQATITADATTAPDGSTTADRLNASAGTTPYVFTSSGISTSSNCTVSAYLKKGTNQYAILSLGANSTSWGSVVADLNAGTITQTSAQTYSVTSSAITSVGNGWYRVSAYVTGIGGGSSLFVTIEHADSGTPSIPNGSGGVESWTSAGTETLFVWGAQVEESPVVSTYIPTIAASVTRARDIVGCAASAIGFSTTLSSMYLDYTLPYTGETAAVIQIENLAQISTISISHGVGNDTNLYVTDNNVTQALISHGTDAVGHSQLSGAFQANNFAVSLNGAPVSTDTSGTYPTGPDTFEIGYDQASGGHTYRTIARRLVYVPRRVGDSELPYWRFNK